MNSEKVSNLRIERSAKSRPKTSIWIILFVVAAVTGVAVFFALPKKDGERRIVNGKSKVTEAAPAAVGGRPGSPNPVAVSRSDALLTVSGYIINRERIEISPRFMGVVNWIGVKKGDAVTNGQVVVLLDDTEYKGRLLETEGRLAFAKATLEKAQIAYERTAKLALDNVESKQLEDDARLGVELARGSVKEMEGQWQVAKTYVDWTVIRSPINGVVLDKLVDPNELVVPQSFGGTRGPSTALIAVADPKDLQVEVDLNESDVAKVYLGQRCRVSPEAYPDKIYEGYVTEKAPEANRQKGTLQVKVQIKNPDHYLTPELSAKVEFLPSN